MIDLNKKYLGLSYLTWIILVIVIVFLFNNIQNNSVEETETEKFANNCNNIKIYNFNTSWCGYSTRFQDIWDTFAKKANKITRVEAIDWKCDENKDKKMFCDNYKHNIQGYPTVVLEKNNETHEYSGPRTVDGLNDFLNKHIL